MPRLLVLGSALLGGLRYFLSLLTFFCEQNLLVVIIEHISAFMFSEMTVNGSLSALSYANGKINLSIDGLHNKAKICEIVNATYQESL